MLQPAHSPTGGAAAASTASWARLRWAAVIPAGCLMLGLAAGYASWRLNLDGYVERKHGEARTTIAMMDAFVAAYTEYRKKPDKLPVPATFRRHSMELFNASQPNADAWKAYWFGPPGKEIGAPPQAEDLRAEAQQLVDRSWREPYARFLLERPDPVVRTVAPSIASQAGCVDCHRALRPDVEWKLGAPFGAVVLDIPVGAKLRRSARIAVMTGLSVVLLATFLGTAILYLYGKRVRRETEIEAKLERDRQLEVVNRVAEAAVAANRAKSQFLTVMSHELRTPLNAINGFSELIQQQTFGTIDERYRDYASEINRSGQHLLSLINDILDMSKIEAGKHELQPSRFALADVAERAMPLLGPRMKAGDLMLTSDIAADIQLEADERKLQQVLLNLLSNAVKFTP
ncbi:MAG: hypothetical protein FJX68_16160 [Alphaproteobacteria bacterium]|nr:hypothetical protein [Alphaproteobacteria bacterium]